MRDRPQLEALRDVPLLGMLEEPQLERLRSHARIRTLAEGERLFDFGQPATHFYFLAEGRVKLLRFSPDGAEKVLALIGAGETFGEAVMFFERARTYPVTAEALWPSRVISMDNATMLSLLRESPGTCLRMLGDLSSRLRERINEIHHLTLHTATERLVSYLLHHAARDAEGDAVVRLAMPKRVLASLLTIQPETLSRIFARLGRDGLIEVRGQALVLRDTAALQDLAPAGHDDTVEETQQ